MSLSAGLYLKLLAVARRIRTLRLLQGVSLTLLAVTLPLVAMLVADYVRDGLSPSLRVTFFFVWVMLVAGVVWRTLVRPWRRQFDFAALAALVEEQHPELAERLTSTVELAGNTDLYHGSPELIALLLRQTEKQSANIRFTATVSSFHTCNIALVAFGVFMLSSLPAVFWPSKSRATLQRFFLSWSEQRYRLAAVEGDRIAAMGRPLSFTARANLEPGQKAETLPRTATLVLLHANGKEERLPMLAQRPGEFSYRLERVPGSVTYRVEADKTRSPDYTITAIEPVEFAAESPTIVTTPPAYASEQIAAQTTHGLSSVNVLQHGRARFDFAFTRPAVAARLEWTTGDKETRQTEKIELPLSADRKSAHLERLMTGEAEYRLILEAEHDIRTETSSQTVGVWLDRPPGFKDFALARKDNRPVHPQDQVGFSFKAIDDIAVMKADIEIRVNDLKNKSVFQQCPLTGSGTTEANARHHLTLAGLAQPADRVYFRLRIVDNRSVPEANLTPQVAYYPADDWFSVIVASNVAPLVQKSIQDEHNEINKKIEQLKNDLTQERTQVQQLHAAQAQQRGDLTPDQMQNLQDVQKTNRTNEEKLTDLARQFEDTPELRPFTDALRDVARKEVRNSEQALQQAEKKPSERGKELEKSNLQLAEAIRKLNDLQKKNQDIARDRQDQRKLEQLAEREKALADKLAELQDNDPVNKQELQKAQDEQSRVAAELQQLLQQNESLRQALEAMRAEQARELSEKARELAAEQRQLAKENTEREQKERIARLAELAKKQDELNQKAQKLAEETKQPATIAQKAPLNTEEAKKALEALQKGEAQEALRKQHQAALEFDRLAADLDRAQRQAQDAKEAAKQLARWQEAIKEKLADEASKKDAKQSLEERLKKLDREQQALQQAAEKLSVPPQNQDAKETKQEIGEAVQKARESLDKQDVAEAAKQMDNAKESLEKLAAQLPDAETRKRDALAELKRLTEQQEQIGKQAEQAMQKLADAGSDLQKKQDAQQELEKTAQKQADLGKKLEKLDTPNQEGQKAQAQQAQQKAQDDLKKQKQNDIKGSQQSAKNELDKLKDALEGNAPQENKSNDLAKQQKELAEATKQAQQQAAQKPGSEGQKQLEKALEKIGEQQKALNEKAAKEQASKEARDAMNKAQQALEKKDAGEASKQQQAAAQALEQGNSQQQLPTKQQADAARQLAQEQRQLKQALAEMNKPMPATSPADLAKQQQQLAQQAQKMGEQLGQQHGEPAKQAAKQGQEAAQNLQQGKMQEAHTLGESIAQKLQQLSESLGGSKTPQGKEAMQLAQEQQALNAKMAQGQSPGQQALQQQTNDLAKQVQQMAQQSPGSQSLQKASQSAQQAQQAMQAAQQQSQQGNAQNAEKAQQMAAQALEQTAMNLSQAQQGQQQMQPTGQALQQAQKQLGQSQQAMQQGQMKQAQQSSQQAAQQLAEAAQKFNEQQQRGLPGQPPDKTSEHGTIGGGPIDVNSLPPELRPHAGKTWGELPGELRTRLMQDMQKQYGDDYARRIKLYFEQLADRKKKT